MNSIKNIVIKVNVLIVCIITFSCGSSDSYFINEHLKEMTYDFHKDIDGPGFVNPSCSFIIVQIEKQNNYYKVVFSISNPSTFDNLYAIIESKDRTVMIYSESDISELIYTKEPYNPDLKDIKTTDYSFIGEDVYYEVHYFNGTKFSTDSLFNE